MYGVFLEHMGDSVYPQWRCYTYYFFVNKSDGYVQSAMRISSVLRRIMVLHVGDWSQIRGCVSALVRIVQF